MTAPCSGSGLRGEAVQDAGRIVPRACKRAHEPREPQLVEAATRPPRSRDHPGCPLLPALGILSCAPGSHQPRRPRGCGLRTWQAAGAGNTGSTQWLGPCIASHWACLYRVRSSAPVCCWRPLLRSCAALPAGHEGSEFQGDASPPSRTGKSPTAPARAARAP